MPLKKNVDDSLVGQKTVEHVIVLRRCENEVDWQQGKDHWWHDIVPVQSDQCDAEEMDAEDLLYILYTSGSTGKPKGIVHTCGGYMAGVTATFRYVFDIKDDDLYWCTADCGWVTGHSYIVYGPLANGATSLIYEGTPDHPEQDRWWKLIEKYKSLVEVKKHLSLGQAMKYDFTDDGRVLDKNGTVIFDGEKLV